MALQGDVERYEEWRASFDITVEGPHTFRKLDQLRRIDGVVWGNSGWSEAEKVVKISEILSE